MELITVVGARPQFIKAASLSRAFSTCLNGSQLIKESILHTGQHYDSAMSDQFFSELGIPEPTYNLGIGGGSHAANTGRMLEAIEKILLSKNPDAILVYGDTDSTLAGSLAASKLKIPIIHIEAGLRSYNRHQPEEQNRVLTDHLSDLCFAPTTQAVANLSREGIPDCRVIRSGDVMADAARIFATEAESKSAHLLSGLPIPSTPFVLATIHRAENTDDPHRLEQILKAFQNSDLPVVLPLHPRTRKRINDFAIHHLLDSLLVTDPLGFLQMVLLERRASLIVTDSGGMQKEAFFHGTPCVTVRTETEWVELIDNGWNVLANPFDSTSISNAITQQLSFDRLTPRGPIYGDGFASQSILSELINFFSLVES